MGVDFDGLKPGRKCDELVALRVMGWERLSVGYEGTEYETPRQKELTYWLRKVRIEAVGDYFIDVPRNAWTPVEDFRPTRDIVTAWHVFDKVRYQFPPTSREWVAFAGGLGFLPACHPDRAMNELLECLHRMTAFSICRAALAAVLSSESQAPADEDSVAAGCPT